MESYKKLGQNLLISIMEMVGLNKEFAFADGEDGPSCRKTAYRELLKSGSEYSLKDNKNVFSKNISIEMLRLYAIKFENFIPMNKIKDLKYDDYVIV